MTENIYLTGFMGSGKSTVGKHLADLTGRRLLDLDDLLEKEFGRTIREFFAEQGEAAFRHRETALLEKVAGRNRLIVATGGGIVERPENRILMKESGRTVWLETSLEGCGDRLNGCVIEDRPNWRDSAAVAALYARRQSLYAEAGVNVSTDGRISARVALDIVSRLFPEDRFPIRMDQNELGVTVAWDAPEALRQLAGDRRLVILTDRRVRDLHLDRYLEKLNDPLVIDVPGGERIKTLNVARRIYEILLENHFNRDDLLAAVGGGTVTDLGAFVAGTFKRGMSFALVSTSLLGCVDAAVGGKAAVNMGQAKNVIGCFTVPDGVILDVAALATLPRARISEGLVEAYKTGLVADPDLAALIEAETGILLKKDIPLLAEAVSRSARAKAGVVGDDFRESGRRAILNFGHTYGHAVEGWHRYRVSHGQAVAVGMLVAARISLSRGLFSQEAERRISRAVRSIVPRLPELPPVADAMEIMLHDKKIRKGRLVFVLLEGVGEPVIVDDVSREELAQAAADTSAELAGEQGRTHG